MKRPGAAALLLPPRLASHDLARSRIPATARATVRAGARLHVVRPGRWRGLAAAPPPFSWCLASVPPGDEVLVCQDVTPIRPLGRKERRRMRLRLTMLLALLAAAATVMTVAPAASAAPPTATAPSTLDLTGALAGGGTFVGQLTDLRFVNQNGSLAVTGLLSGTLKNAAGTVIGTVTNLPITLPLAGAQAGDTCQILDLTLGPLDLNLLGLVIHLDVVHLEITGQRGP